MKIVVLSPVVYGNTCGHGGGILSFGQLKRLVRKHEVHFISFYKGNDTGLHDPVCLRDLQSICASVTLVPLQVGVLRRVCSKLAPFFRFMPNDAAFISSRNMKSRVLEVVHEITPDVVLIQFPPMAQYVTFNRQTPVVLDVHDVFSVSFFRKFRVETSLMSRIYRLIDWLTWVRYESFFYSQFDAIYTLTEQDRSGLRIFSPELDVDVIPAAVDVPEKMPPLRPLAKKQVLFVGSFYHSPNIDAVKYFLSEIFPLVLQQVPDTEFIVAGKGAETYFKQHEYRQVRFLGFVENIDELYGSSAAVVIPIRFGGGVKIKAIEAMANCCPIVSTSIGMEETGAIHRRHVSIADTPENFAAEIVALLLDDNLRCFLVKNAWELARERFSWESRTELLETLLERVVTGKTRNGTRKL